MGIPKKAFRKQKKINEKKARPQALPEGYKRDPKTGKTYRTIPKLEIDDKGYSDVVVDGLAGINDDPRQSAKDFLGHLQVAPTPEELAALRAEALKKARKAREDYDAEVNGNGTGS